MHSALPPAHSRLRILCERLILLGIAVLLMRTWYVEGLIVPFQVVGGSMAETLLGRHREVTCADCGHVFFCDSEIPKVRRRSVCPLCGHVGDGLDRKPDIAGDRLLLGKSIFRLRPPRRWEVVAMRHPDRAAKAVVKRVVGLPGEAIQIVEGDVYVDGQIQRKSLPTQQALAVLVHRADRQPTLTPDAPSAWRPEDAENSSWGTTNGRFGHPWLTEREPIDDWLVYHHLRRRAGKASGFKETPVTDLCGYNQTHTRREEDVRPVTDLMLAFRLEEALGDGQLVLRASDGRDRFEARLTPRSHRYEVLQNGRPVPAAAGKCPRLQDGATIVFSLFDCQLLLAFDDEVVVQWPYGPAGDRREPSARPLAIGSQGGLGAVLSDVRIYRDVYYTHPIGPQGPWALAEPCTLGDREYFVLGDNSPISDDSRNWATGPGVDADLLLGKPLLVHFPAKWVEWGDHRFQVPDPARIRYIR